MVGTIFPETRQSLATVRAAQAKNNRRLIGLFANNAIVGWASIWPVEQETSRALESGQIADDQLDESFLLASDAQDCPDALVLMSFAIAEAHRFRPSAIKVLGAAVLEHVIKDYSCMSQKRGCLIANIVSKEGAHMARVLGLRPNGNSIRNGEQSVPIYTGRLDFELLKRLHRRLTSGD